MLRVFSQQLNMLLNQSCCNWFTVMFTTVIAQFRGWAFI